MAENQNEKDEKNKKNTLYVIGNGFDLFLGLKSRYIDYIKNKSLDSKISNLSLKISDGIKKMRILNLENYIKDFFEDNKEINLFIIHILCFSKYRNEGYNNYNDENILWLDVENEIYNYILGMSLLVEKYKNFNGNIYNFINSQDNYNMKISRMIAYYYLKNKEQEILKGIDFFLKKELEKFEKDFGEYIEYEESKISKNQELINKIYNIIIKEEVNYVLSFNYTNYLKKYCTVYNIHGTYEKPIMGINLDFYDMNNLLYELKTNYYQETIYYNSMYTNNNGLNQEAEHFTGRLNYYGKIFNKTFRINNNSNISKMNLASKKNINKIVVFGHSFNQQDLLYYIGLFDMFNLLDGDLKLEILYYDYLGDKYTVRENLDIMVYDLLQYYNYYKENNQIFKIYDKLLLENRINVIEIDEEGKRIRNENY